MNVRDYERTIYEARLDAAYNAVACEKHATLLTRITMLANAITIGGSTAAFVAWKTNHPGISVIAGGVLGALGVWSVVSDYPGRAATFRAQRRRYLEARDSKDSKLDEFDRKLRAIEADDPPMYAALKHAAYNENVTSAGRPDYAVPMGRWRRLVAWLA